MRFSIATAVIAASAVALLSTHVSAALTEKEKADIREMDGDNAVLCPPCLQKAMHNHFPHACARNLDPNQVRMEATDEEEHCVCVAFQDLSWMKADCSFECPYVFNPKSMAMFLHSSKIDGCDKWIDFETGMEIPVKGHLTKDPSYKPEVYEIAPEPPKDETVAEEEDDGRGYDVSVKITTEASDAKLKEERERLELESGLKVEPAVVEESKTEAEAETEKTTKDEL
ncbi:hypothetical protein BGZ83_002978 [Gryganskiella cystojenkinii]|nr:hypothetical protein BGZ83_002978 [Gryganskiella cystojenkinii]